MNAIAATRWTPGRRPRSSPRDISHNQDAPGNRVRPDCGRYLLERNEGDVPESIGWRQLRSSRSLYVSFLSSAQGRGVSIVVLDAGRRRRVTVDVLTSEFSRLLAR